MCYVLSGPTKCVRVILEAAEADIAIVAKQAPYLPVRMIMVDVKITSAASKSRSPAYCTPAVLGRNHTLKVLDRQAIFAQAV